MKTADVIKKIKDFITSQPKVAGLEISTNALKFILIENSSNILQASLKLPPGIIEAGKVKDQKNLVAALQSLHLQVAPLTKRLNVVLVVPSQLVYAQSFNIPYLEDSKLEEAISLNLQTISPSRPEESYYDWQEIKENKDAGHADLLGAFATRKEIDAYTSALSEAGFSTVAVEFPGLAIARLIKDRWENIDVKQHYLGMYLSTEGVLTVILKNNNLSFNHFTPWSDAIKARNEALTFEDVKGFLTQELQRVLNFYASHANKRLEEIILISPFFNYEIVQIGKENFNLMIKNLALGETNKPLSPSWYVSLGAAIRGIQSTSADTAISLSERNAQNEYYRGRVASFAKIWRDIAIASLILLIGATTFVDAVVANYQKEIGLRANQQVNNEDALAINSLREKAQAFNTILGITEKALALRKPWSPFLTRLTAITGTGITLEKVSADKSNLNVLLVGRATNELTAINFKNRLAEEKNISNVVLPLSQIKTEGDQTVSFSLTFKLNSLEFK